ncbi:hypothetical protein EKO27_g3351 [Xylaria grammica]|uniref:PNPLA domain-containing protein n=1 Tax=Xylaria grammica TaxID=363999 RepID=A0A439DBI6_9PEZI|nr:hypothetical protein EKO27_g3351 [Xylaria grammica]
MEAEFEAMRVDSYYAWQVPLVVAYAEVYDESEGPRTLDSTYIFRPYDLDAATNPLAANPGRACELAVRVVARATTAAPTYFKPEEIRVPGEQVWRFKDGGMRANNPTLEGVREVRQRHGHQADFVISIGTCSRIKLLFEKTRANGVRDLLNDGWYAIRGLTDTRKVHQNASRDYAGVSPGYFRFDDEASPEWKHIKMDEWKGDRVNGPGSRTLGKIRQLIAAYLGGNNPMLDQRLEQCAEQLVRRRRLRQLAADEWERYALGSSFRCRYPDCVDQVPFNSRNQLTQHIQTHPAGMWCEERPWVYNSSV